VVSRLLIPEMFGVMAVANVFMMGFLLFSDIGLHANIVQSSRGDQKSFLNTVWTTQIMRGVVIFIFGCLISIALLIVRYYGWLSASSAYADPSLPAIVLALAFSSALGAFESTKVVTATRSLDVKHVKIIEIFSTLAGMFFTVFWAWYQRSIWAFVYGGLISSVTKVILSHYCLKGINNSFEWYKDEFKEIYGYGKWIFVSSVIGFFYLTIDKIMLGAIMTPNMFGLFAIAMLILSAVKDVFSKVFYGVCFPVFSETFRENPEKIKSTYYKYRVLSDIGLCFFAGLLFVIAPIIFGIIYDDRYQGAGQIFQILSISLIGLRNELTQQMFNAIGKPKLMTMIMVVNLVMLAISIPLINYYFGIYAALWAIAVSPFFVTPLMIKYKVDLGFFSFYKELIGLIFLPVGYLLGLGIVYLFNLVKL